nr:retrovirus-related Pol polyprotein from transposon TNT 1-94 [Tanacetum cinerariifolium]
MVAASKVSMLKPGVEITIAPATTKEKEQRRAPRSVDTKYKESTRRTMHVETPASLALVSCDGLGGYDWSDQAEEGVEITIAPATTKEKEQRSKAFRVFNNKTTIVEENFHTRFSENTPNMAGSGPTWLFYINTLTKSMNYKLVVAGNQSNGNAGTKARDDAGKARMETVPGKDYIKVDEDPRQEIECKDQEKEDNVSNTNNVNVIGTNEVNVVGANTNNELLFDSRMPALEDISTFNFSSDHEDDDEDADMNNLDTTIQVSPTPTTRIDKDHPIEQVIRDLHSTTPTRNMSKTLEEHGFVTTIHQRTNYKDLQNCLFACFYHKKNLKIVLVVKPHKKTPYELFHGRTPALSFMRPFGCPVTILNTKDHIGKFDGKADEGFFVGYTLNSKAFRVFNNRTTIVEENFHIRFSENTPNIAGSGPTWLFDINTLTKSMNYKLVVVGNQSNGNAGTKARDDAGKARMETVPGKDYIVLPLLTADLFISQKEFSR